jgi:hypothetical protein
MGLIVLALFIPCFAIPPADFTGTRSSLGWSGAVVDRTLLYVHTLALPLAGWCLVVIAGRKLRGTPLTYGMTVIAVIALGVLLGRHGQHLGFMNSTYIASPGPRVDLSTTSPSVEFLQQQTKIEPGRVQGLEWCMFAGFSTIYGLEFINGANALENRRYREFAEAAKLVEPSRWVYETPVRDLPRLRPIFDFLNVRYLAEPGTVELPVDGYRQVGSFDLNVLESENSWPRAYFADRVEHYATTDELVHRISQRVNQPAFAAIQESDPLPSSLRDSRDGAETATIVPAVDYELKTNNTAFTIVAPKAGIAVLHEPWLADDFTATLNGKPVQYFRVNHAFKGIVIPAPGSHRIEFSYWPHGFTESLVAAAIGLALIVASLFATRIIAWPNRSSPTPVDASA